MINVVTVNHFENLLNYFHTKNLFAKPMSGE